MKTYLKISGEAFFNLVFMKEAQAILKMKVNPTGSALSMVVRGSPEQAKQAIAWFVGGDTVLRVEELSETEWSSLDTEPGWSLVSVPDGVHVTVMSFSSISHT